MRKLMIFSISFSLSTLCLTFLTFSAGWLTVCAVFFLFSLLLVFFRKRSAVITALFCFCLGAFWGILAFSAHEVFRIKPLEAWDDTTTMLSFRLTDFPEAGNGYVRVSGKATADHLPQSEILLYDNGDQYQLEQYQPGDVISCEVRLKSTRIRYGEPYYGAYATGLYLKGYILSEPLLTGGAETFLRKLVILPVLTREKISELINRVFAPSVRPFMQSLMINDRQDFQLDTELNNAMSRAGIMHIVAVSGMHIAFLVGVIRLLFGSGKGSSILCLLIVCFFVMISGAPVSAVRAGIMQSLLLIAPLLHRENDLPTALSTGLLIILAVNPWAVRSVSLQLSFGAVAGILLFAKPLYRRLMKFKLPKVLRPVFDYVAGVVCSSIGVMIITVPVCAWHFRSVQVLSLVTNILVLWAVSFCFCLGYLAVLLCPLIPFLSRFAAVPAAFLATYIMRIAEWISSLPHAALYIGYAGNRALYVLIAVYALFILFRFLPLRLRHRITVPLLLSFILFCGLISCTKLEYDSYSSVFNVIDVGQGQCIAVFSGTDTVMIDCGSTMTVENAGAVAGRYLRSCQRSKVDVLILTHLHTDHANGVKTLMDYVPVKRILILEDLKGDEELLPSIMKAAEDRNTAVEFIGQDSMEQIGKISLNLYRSSDPSEDDNERCLICLSSIGDYDMLVTGDISKKSEETFLNRAMLPKIECLILGHHGSKNSTSDALLQACQNATGVISTGYNTYGHPADITLQNASKQLSALYRTDRQGSIQFIQEKKDQSLWLKKVPRLAITQPKRNS